MASLTIEGMQWGDEGKGKITDYFASKADIVVRSQGGNNAGHSVQHGDKRYALRLLPSGILHPAVTNVIADGAVVDPEALLKEIDGLKEAGIAEFSLLLSDRATLLLPYHIALDKAREAFLAGKKIGTTGRGIGPCYEDRASRNALRIGDLLYPKYLHERLSSALLIRNKELSAYGVPPFDADELYGRLLKCAERLKPYITDTGLYLYESGLAGKRILFEGAQGAMLSLSAGTYPYVTSSSPIATAVAENASIPSSMFGEPFGVFKAYTTRVGNGPFVSEIQSEGIAAALRDAGHEYGTVTGRPRRIGWLDIPLLRYVCRISGIKHAAITLLDVLSAVKEIRVVTSYSLHGVMIGRYPATIAELEEVAPEYISLPSWHGDISGARAYDELPPEARAYIGFIEKELGLAIDIVSVGPKDSQTIVRREVF